MDFLKILKSLIFHYIFLTSKAFLNIIIKYFFIKFFSSYKVWVVEKFRNYFTFWNTCQQNFSISEKFQFKISAIFSWKIHFSKISEKFQFQRFFKYISWKIQIQWNFSKFSAISLKCFKTWNNFSEIFLSGKS